MCKLYTYKELHSNSVHYTYMLHSTYTHIHTHIGYIPISISTSISISMSFIYEKNWNYNFYKVIFKFVLTALSYTSKKKKKELKKQVSHFEQANDLVMKKIFRF